MFLVSVVLSFKEVLIKIYLLYVVTSFSLVCYYFFSFMLLFLLLLYVVISSFLICCYFFFSCILLLLLLLYVVTSLLCCYFFSDYLLLLNIFHQYNKRKTQSKILKLSQCILLFNVLCYYIIHSRNLKKNLNLN